MKPLLSILIPTYNRAEFLKDALHSLVPQIKDLEGEVELVVSDNCSTDRTPEVITWAERFGPIRYYRNGRNLGAHGNILLLTNKLARGLFGWILCDDDVARPEAVTRVVSALKAYPEVDYVFVNISNRSSSERRAFNRPVSAADFPELLPVKCKQLNDRYVEQWEELIDPEIDGVFLGSAMCSVFRLSVWNQYRLEVPQTDKTFPSLEHTYTHSVILAQTMLGRPAYYLGYPCIITFFGDQEWLDHIPMIFVVRLQELLDLYQKNGVDSNRLRKCREALLDDSADALRAILFDPGTPGREYFSLRQFLWRNRNSSVALFRLFAKVSRTQPRPSLRLRLGGYQLGQHAKWALCRALAFFATSK